MDIRKLGSIGFILTSAIAGGLLVGCGGSESVGAYGGNIVTTGGLTTPSGSNPGGTINASAQPQQVQIMINGVLTTVTLPANETVPAGSNVATITPGIPILDGLTLSPRSRGQKVDNTVSNGAQGEVDVDGCDTGLTVNSQGDLSGYLILVPGTHNITAIGPFEIQGGSAFKPTVLSIGNFIFNVTVNPDGIASIPSALSVNLPINGGSLKNGHFVKVTLPTPEFAGGFGKLIISWPGLTISQTKTYVNGVVIFKALANNTPIPTTGVSSVQFNYNP